MSHLALGMSHFSQTMGYRLEQPRGQKCRKEDATVQGIVLTKGVKLEKTSNCLQFHNWFTVSPPVKGRRFDLRITVKSSEIVQTDRHLIEPTQKI